ncbi:hypothetical protein ACQW02_16035 [Humitalea sp. 24SJ18S-53]|uniref:hypothetical protein n=1 Tax=Humitalea sp. 24SJ18S-53 TaxID=3422307 RepID=UPI003D66D33D
MGRRIGALALAVTGILAVGGCESSRPATRTGAALDRAGTQTGAALGRAADSTGAALNRAGEWVREKTN